jgi:hypothetical protein
MEAQTALNGVCYKFNVFVGSYQNSKKQTVGFEDQNGKFTTIAYPGSASTQATGINDNGVIAGHYTTSANTGYQGFLATP